MRRIRLAALALCAVAASAAADPAPSPAATSAVAPNGPSAATSGAARRRAAGDPPRWRLRLSLTQGFGGARAGDVTVARFATTAELGARVWGPLSIDVGVIGTVAGEYDASCGQGIRPSAVAGVAGIRADAYNGRSASWASPFVEAHGGVGAQAGAREVPGGCAASAVFATGGARAGVDVWLGRAAVTAALAFDYLPIGSAVSFTLGGSFKLL